MESLKLLRRIRKTVGGRAMDDFLEQVELEQLHRMSLELHRIRQGFDLTDYLDVSHQTILKLEMSDSFILRETDFWREKWTWHSDCSNAGYCSTASNCLCYLRSRNCPTGNILQPQSKYKFNSFFHEVLYISSRRLKSNTSNCRVI